MNRRRSISLSAISCLATLVTFAPFSEALAATPGEINFQGLLLDSAGEVVNGLVDLDFELFDAASAGTSLWSESQPDVSVLDGVYDVALGAITPISAAVLAGGSVWLEITVEGVTLSPRQPLRAVPYALRSAESDHATSADTTDTVATLPSGTLEAIYALFPFDGAAPPNDDPSEGLADTDNDGVLNFIDPDNDNDGILDGDEVAQGSNINLTTPTISAASPSIASDIFPTPIVITGTGFILGQTVAVGPQTPTSLLITPTGFGIVLDPQPAPTSTSIIVTRPNGEQASVAFGFELTLPTITSLSPPFINLSEAATIDVVGTDFLGAITVTVDGSPVTPSNVTTTSFSIDVVAPASPASLPIVVTLSNGQSVSQPLSVATLKTVFVTSTGYTGNLGGLSGGDALCASRATAAGLSGTFLSWLSDSTASPSTRFTQSPNPYRLVDNTIIADDWADLIDGFIVTPINLDEFGNPRSSLVWTATDFLGGLTVPTCSDWNSTAGDGAVGTSTDNLVFWTQFFMVTRSCETTNPLYCFEQ